MMAERYQAAQQAVEPRWLLLWTMPERFRAAARFVRRQSWQLSAIPETLPTLQWPAPISQPIVALTGFVFAWPEAVELDVALLLDL